MSISNDRPYAQFNFLVDLGDGAAESPHAGFQEVSGLGMDAPASKHRREDTEASRVKKIKGVNKAASVTLKRGVVASRAFQQWLDEIRNGREKAVRTVVIRLQAEDQASVARTWTLAGARISKHTAGPFNAKGTDVAIEELVLSCDRLESE